MHIWFILNLSVVLFSFYNFESVKSNHHFRHEKQKNSNSTSENEFNKINSHKFENSDQIQMKYIRPPTYLSLMYKKLLTEQKSIFTNGEPILRALIPNQVTNEDFGSGFLSYDMSQDKLNHFTSAHLILTRNGNVNSHDRAHVNVNIQFKNQENILSQRIQENMRFYSFNISELLRDVFKEMPNATIIDLKCDIFKNIRRKKIWFEELFDIENEQPFIIFEYQKIDMTGFFVQEMEQKTHSFVNGKKIRTRRSITTKILTTQNNPIVTSDRVDDVTMIRPLLSKNPSSQVENEVKAYPPSLEPHVKTVCRKHEWLVIPSEVSLDDIIEPRKLDLGFCAGSCPYPLLNDVFNFTLHSYFVDQHRLLKGFNIPSNFPTSNCVPVTYKQIMVMELETEKGFIVTTHQNAAVESCGCR